MMKEKSQEPDLLSNKTVFTIKHSEIPQGRTQCIQHSWVKLNDNELHCPVCDSVIITNADIIDK